MILSVTKYGDPILRKKGARIEKITPEIKKLIADMFETMNASHGVGLAAQQVGHALQLTVIDVREASKDRPSTLELDGQPADVDEIAGMLASLKREIPREKVLLMPEGITQEVLRSRAGWLSELCKARGYRYAHRLHVELCGNQRGT